MTKVIIIGQLSLDSSKSGRQYARLDVEIPYPHEAQITIVPDDEEISEDDFQAQLVPYYGKEVTIMCEVDESFGLMTTPSQITSDPLAEIERLNSVISLIADYASGGIIDNDVARDRHEMIHIARSAKRGMNLDQLKEIQR